MGNYVQSISFIASCCLLLLLLLGVVITSEIILLVLSTFLSSGVIWRFHEKDMLWSSLSNFISPLSSLLTFIVLSFFVSLNEQGLQEQFNAFRVDFNFIS